MNADSYDDSKEKPVDDEYLWDRSGAPGPEIQRFESLLAGFAYDERPLVLPAEIPGSSTTKPPRLLLRFASFPRLATAALVLLAISGAVYIILRPKAVSDRTASWQVSTLNGAPQIGSRGISAKNTTMRVGQTLTTDAASRASLFDTDLGEILVDPNSRVRLLQSRPGHKRIQLDVGTIHAAIWAPPTEFIVETPSATAVDLGCRYTLQVGEDGSGSLRTTLGWVGFHLNGRDSFIPAGAMCSTRRDTGPGTPFFEDASPGFRSAVAQFDSSPSDSPAQAAALSAVLAEARARDAFSLWHLLSRTSGAARLQVYSRLAALIPPPHGVTRDGILQLNPNMLDLYWNALNLGDISIWHFWEQSSSPTASPKSPESEHP